MKDAIIQLWNECHNILWIALKLGLFDYFGEPDTEFIESIIDDPANYCNVTTQEVK